MNECVCTNAHHGGKIWKCGTVECLKPHKGTMHSDRRVEDNRGFVFCGRFIDHPYFHGEYGHTSYVVYETPHHKGQPFEIETLNSRYTIVEVDDARKTVSARFSTSLH